MTPDAKRYLELLARLERRGPTSTLTEAEEADFAEMVLDPIWRKLSEADRQLVEDKLREPRCNPHGNDGCGGALRSTHLRSWFRCVECGRLTGKSRARPRIPPA